MVIFVIQMKTEFLVWGDPEGDVVNRKPGDGKRPHPTCIDHSDGSKAGGATGSFLV